jgi:hypothetical protein
VHDPAAGAEQTAEFNQRLERVGAIASRQREPVDAFERVVDAFYRVLNGEPIAEPSLSRDVKKLDAEDLAFAHFIGSRLLGNVEAARNNAATLANAGAKKKPGAKPTDELGSAFGRLTDLVNQLAQRGTVPPTDFKFPETMPQSTFPEAKRIARGLALGPDGIGWSEIIGEFALMHLETGAEHSLRLEGGLIPEWWGKPSDNASLRGELAETGHDGVAIFYNAVGLVLHSDAGHVDVEIDDLIARVGIDPRSSAERTVARLKVWRILTILGAVRVVGARRRVVRDRVTGKNVQLESTDPLLSVSPWKRVGTQETFDAGAAPLAVTLQATPWLSRWRGNRAVLQDFGNLLAISEIPIGKPSGAWARAIGWALQQVWREQATRATYGRAGDDHRATARFQPFTRRQLLEMFPPRPSVQDVLKSTNPVRAITYWDAAIAELRARGVVNHYDGSRDWAKRPRQGWAELWLDEPLDVRPSAAGVDALAAIATSAKRKRRRPT